MKIKQKRSKVKLVIIICEQLVRINDYNKISISGKGAELEE